MNTKNNSRYKTSSQKIEDAFLSLIHKHKYESITICQICEQAHINRSTFYTHYDDINDLIIKIESNFANCMAKIFHYGTRQTHEAFIEMFTFIRNHQAFYKAFLNIPYATLAESNTKTAVLSNIENLKTNDLSGFALYYRASFFGAGIKEMCRLWLARDCQETPEQMATLLLAEYAHRER